MLQHYLNQGQGLAALDTIDRERQEHEQAIQQYTGSDPLLPWLDYIQWTRNAYPAGGSDSHLVPLLEQCTKQFQDDERYRDNERYLKVWILYIDSCRNPEEMFVFLRGKRIGQKSALFYQAWALLLEQLGKKPLAEKVLLTGMAVKASPLQALQNTLDRMKARSAPGTNQQSVGSIRPTAGAGAVRAGAAAAKPKRGLGGASFTVCEENTTSRGPDLDRMYGSEEVTGWRSLNTVEAKNKENDGATGLLGDAIAQPSRTRASAAAGAQLEDEDEDAAPVVAEAPAAFAIFEDPA